MLADTLGRLVRFRITPGQASDIIVAPDLLKGLQAQGVLANIATPKRRAASLCERPSRSTASTTRSCESVE